MKSKYDTMAQEMDHHIEGIAILLLYLDKQDEITKLTCKNNLLKLEKDRMLKLLSEFYHFYN